MVRWTQPRRDEDGGPALVTHQVDNDDVRGLAAGQPPRATGAGQKGSEDESYDEDEGGGVRLEQLRECSPTLARATRIIAAHPRLAAELFIALPSSVYPHAVRAVLAEMDDKERIALAELLDDPEVENALHYLVLLACPPSTEDEDADDSKPVT